jgi:hypothetical protein
VGTELMLTEFEGQTINKKRMEIGKENYWRNNSRTFPNLVENFNIQIA